jgi:hypothetical protein
LELFDWVLLTGCSFLGSWYDLVHLALTCLFHLALDNLLPPCPHSMEGTQYGGAALKAHLNSRLPFWSLGPSSMLTDDQRWEYPLLGSWIIPKISVLTISNIPQDAEASLTHSIFMCELVSNIILDNFVVLYLIHWSTQIFHSMSYPYFIVVETVSLCSLVTILLPQPSECWDYRHVPPHTLLSILITWVFIKDCPPLLWEWDLNSGLWACKAGALLLEPPF